MAEVTGVLAICGGSAGGPQPGCLSLAGGLQRGCGGVGFTLRVLIAGRIVDGFALLYVQICSQESDVDGLPYQSDHRRPACNE